MTVGSRRIGAALVAAALLFTGCSDGTGPGEPFDPAKAEADLAALGTLFQSPQLAAFTELSAHFNMGGGAPLAAVRSASALVAGGDASPATARRMVTEVAQALSLDASSGIRPSLQSLPPDALGTTFVFDTISDTYVESDRTGAPGSGVRFIVYAVDPISGNPLVGQEVGYADLIDLSPSSQTSIGLRLLLVSGGTTYLDYSFSATANQTAIQLGVTGFLYDGTTRLNFSVDTDLVLDEDLFAIDVDFSFAIPTRQFSTSGSFEAVSTPSSSLVEVDFTIMSGGTRIRYDIAEDEVSESINATVYVNNRVFATITGDPSDPEVLGANGNELTFEEASTLVGLLVVAEGCLEFFFQVMEPAGNALGGGFLP